MPVRRERPLLCPVLHAEMLHRPDVWRATSALLDAVERRGGRMTLFVSPFWALVHQVDISGRVAEIAARGHEVGQHTHYYDWDGTPDPAYRKHTDLDAANVRRCLDRDHAALVGFGIRPRGFVSGGWEVHADVPAWLAGHGFRYDSSARTWAAGDGLAGVGLASDGMAEVATTHSLRRAAVDLADARLTWQPHGGRRYAQYYAHDYDLVRPSRRRAMAAVAAVARRTGARCVAVGDVLDG